MRTPRRPAGTGVRLSAQFQRESRGLKFRVGDRGAIARINRRREQCVHNFEERMRVDARFAERREGFSESFQACWRS